MSLSARREALLSVQSRYLRSDLASKGRIIDEFVATTGYARKYAISLLNSYSTSRPCSLRRARGRKYCGEVERALLVAWNVSGGLCGKRLAPFLPELVERLEHFGEISLCPKVKERLLQISPATVDRILSRLHTQKPLGISTTKPGTLLKQQIPIRTFADWSEARPGFVEVDLVAHCGEDGGGEFVYTLDLTDVSTGWTECYGLVNRSQASVCNAIDRVRNRMPFALLGIDSDNGGEFINHLLFRYCTQEQITFTRCRPYKKNDQCRIEQKNWDVVRKIVGYARYEGQEATVCLNNLYNVLRLYQNFFQPSMKLVHKERVGARVIKKYDQPKTPFQRLIEAQVLGADPEADLRQYYQNLNPAELHRQIERYAQNMGRHAKHANTATARPNNNPPGQRSG